MMNFNAKDFDVLPGTDVTLPLHRLLEKLSRISGEKTLTIEPGEYFLSRENALCEELHITNTVAEKELAEIGGTLKKYIGVYLKEAENLTIEAAGATFLTKGLMTNMVLDACENITIKGLSFSTLQPDVHRIKILKRGFNYLDFELDRASDYYVEPNGKIYLQGEGFKRSFDDDSRACWWYVGINADRPGNAFRTSNPLCGAKITSTAPYVFRAKYKLVAPKLRAGDIRYIFSVIRTNVGVFINNSKDIALLDFAQHFNYSLAIVAQNSENLTFERLDMTPREGWELTSVADFIQICFCRGDIKVTDSRFVGANDDVLNAHGMHLKLVKKKDNRIVVRFMHPQSFGYNAYRPGDIIEYVNPASLLSYGQSKVVSSKMLDLYDIELELDAPSEGKIGDAVDNLSANPKSLVFARNYMDYITTRGLLLTVRGKILIEDNTFKSTSMSGILVADDAANWYESGPVNELTVRGNKFLRTEDFCINVSPENRVKRGAVHSNFLIENNEFHHGEHTCISLKSVKNVVIRNNTYEGSGKKLVTSAAEDVQES